MHNREFQHSYLVKENIHYGPITKLKVIEITKTSIKFERENGNTFRTTKQDTYQYKVIEDLGYDIDLYMISLGDFYNQHK